MSIQQHRVTQSLPCYYAVAEAAAPAGLLIALHGYGGNKDSMLRLARDLAPANTTVASLQGPFPHVLASARGARPTGHGFGWITDFNPADAIALHHALVQRVIDAHADGRPVTLLGFSQPVALNLRFAFTFPGAVWRVLGVCGGIPGDWDEAAAPYVDAPVSVGCVGAEDDPIYPPATVHANAARLRRRAADVTVEIVPGGHRFNRRMQATARTWLAG